MTAASVRFFTLSPPAPPPVPLPDPEPPAPTLAAGRSWKSHTLGEILATVAPIMPSTHHRTGLIVRRLAVFLGVTGVVVALSAPAFASPVQPTLSASQSTFVIPTGTTSTWTLKLWWQGTMVGSDSAKTGTLTVAVPSENPCSFQADVSQTAANGQTSYYSGVRRTFPVGTCGKTPPPTSTIAGDIFLCSATGTRTTTEVSLGNLAVTGTSLSQGNPLPATPIASGPWSMTATAPPGYNFVGCGGSAIPDSSALTATDLVQVPPGGAGMGSFYVVAVTPVGTVGTSGPPSSPGSSVNAPSSSPGNSGPSTVTTAHKTPATPVGSSHLAFTGFNTKPLLLLALASLSLGTLATLVSRSRRRASGSNP